MTKSNKKYRFNFPYEVSSSRKQIQLSSIANTTGIFYKLAHNEDTNFLLLQQWNANMDIQIVGCKYAVVQKNEHRSLKSELSATIEKLPGKISGRKCLCIKN